MWLQWFNLSERSSLFQQKNINTTLLNINRHHVFPQHRVTGLERQWGYDIIFIFAWTIPLKWCLVRFLNRVCVTARPSEAGNTAACCSLKRENGVSGRVKAGGPVESIISIMRSEIRGASLPCGLLLPRRAINTPH